MVVLLSPGVVKPDGEGCTWGFMRLPLVMLSSLHSSIVFGASAVAGCLRSLTKQLFHLFVYSQTDVKAGACLAAVMVSHACKKRMLRTKHGVTFKCRTVLQPAGACR